MAGVYRQRAVDHGRQPMIGPVSNPDGWLRVFGSSGARSAVAHMPRIPIASNNEGGR